MCLRGPPGREDLLGPLLVAIDAAEDTPQSYQVEKPVMKDQLGIEGPLVKVMNM